MAKKVIDEFDQYKVSSAVGVEPIDEFDQYKVKKKDGSEPSGETLPSNLPQTSPSGLLDFDLNKPFQFEEKPTAVAADKVLTAPIRPVNQFTNPVTKYETIRKTLEDQHIATPKPLGYSPENDRLDVAVNNIIAKKLASDPYEEYPSERPEQTDTSWGWGIANNLSKGVASLLNDFGDVLDIVKPFTTESRWKEQQKYKAMTPNEWNTYSAQKKQNARKDNPFHLLSDYYQDLSKDFKPLPDHPAAYAIEGAIGTLPLIAELMLTPEIKALQLGGVAVNIPKMATLEGLRGYYKGVTSGGNVKDKLKAGFVQGLEGAAFGTIMHSMGFTSNVLGKVVGNKTGSELLGGLTNMATNSGLFGAYDAYTQKMNTGGIDLNQVWGSVGTGAILGIPAVFGGAVADRKNPKLEFARNLYKKSFNTFMSSSDEAISMVNNMQFDPEKMREMTITLGNKIAASTEIGEKNKIATQQRLLNNLIEINAMSQDVVTNPDFYKKIVGETDMAQASKDMFVRKIDKLIADTGERQADVDSKIMTAREGNKVQFKAPQLFIDEETSKVFTDIETDRPVTNNRLQAASNNLFDEYKRLETIKYSSLRSNTMDEISDAQKFLEKQITNLENQKSVQAEKGLFINLKGRGDKGKKVEESPVEQPVIEKAPEAEPIVSPVTQEEIWKSREDELSLLTNTTDNGNLDQKNKRANSRGSVGRIKSRRVNTPEIVEEQPRYDVGGSRRTSSDATVKAVIISPKEARDLTTAIPTSKIDTQFSESKEPELFHSAISESQAGNKFAASVEVHPLEDYQKYRLFLTDDAKAGIALTPDGDIVSAFSFGEGKGRFTQMFLHAIKEGGVKLDAFNTILPDLYSKFGFVPVARVKWSDEKAPNGWDKEAFKKYNNGEPDVVLMAYHGGNKATLSERIGKFGNIEKMIESTPVVNSWEEGVKLQQEYIDRFKKETGGKENASAIQSTEPVSELEVRPPVDEEASLRQLNKVSSKPKEESSGINPPDDNAPQIRKTRVRKQLETNENPKVKAAGFFLFGDVSDLIRGRREKRKPITIKKSWEAIKKQFSPSKGLPREWFNEYTRATGAIKARAYDIENAAHDIIKEAKDVYGQKIEKDQLLEIQKAFENLGLDQASRDLVINTIARNMPVEMLPVVDKMRKMVDSYTDEIANLEMIGIELENKLEKNQGYYVTRTYAKHTNRDWTWENIPTKIKQSAADVLSDAFPPESAIHNNTDLLGDLKAEWMNRGLKNKIEDAQKNGDMQKAFEDGRISAQDYIDFIDAANKPDKKGVSKNLQVPKEVTDKLEIELDAHADRINGMLKGMLEKDDMITSVVSRGENVADIDKGPLKRRSKFLTDHPEIREFLGENKDPFYNFAVSLTKMAEIIERGQMIENFRKIGVENKFISEEQSLLKGHTAKIKYDDSRYKGKPGTKKLSEYYTTPEIAESMSKFFDDQHVTNKWARTYLKALTAVKLSKTAWSVKGTVRNFKSNVTNFIGNGNWNVHQILGEFNTRRKDWKAFHRELLANSVIGDNANAGELMRNLQDLTEKMTNVDRSDEGFVERAKRKAIDLPLKSYSFVDDVWKVARYLSEYTRYRDVYKKRGMNEADATEAAKKEAMRILHKTSTYYSQLPKFIQEMRKLPFANTFISFPYLTTTNFIGSIETAINEMKAADTASIGAQRLAGAMMGVTVLAATAGIANKKRGQDARKMQAWRRFLPKFWSNDIITIKKDNGNGTATYKNTSYLDYYNAITTPMLILGRQAMANGELTTDDVKDAAIEFTKNFLAWDILFERIDDLKDNETPYGKRIYNETEDLTTQYKDIVGYFMGVFEPATSTDVRRIVKAAREGEDAKAQAKGALFGNQVRSIDPVKSMSYFMLPKYKDELQYAREIYKKPMRDYNRLKNPNDKDREKLVEAKVRSENVINRLLEQIQIDYDAALEVGVKDQDLQKVIKDARFDSDIRNAIYTRGKVRLNDEGGIIGTGNGLELKP